MLKMFLTKKPKLSFIKTPMLPHPESPKSRLHILITLSAAMLLATSSLLAQAQDTDSRGRKYHAPPPTAHVSVAVIKDTNGKPIENAAVVFHLFGEEGKGNMEMKTNEDGKAIIDVVPIGDSIRLQVIADGFQTFGEDYKIDADTKDITVRLKRPGQQYSTYAHASAASGTAPAAQTGAPKQNSTQTPPKQ
jgi:Carboxypeptidase regulatory-like domain